jgi:phosphonopyruvate decarboxylase
MSMGSLATIATMKPKNLIIICVDNSLYLETGGQKSHTGLGVDLNVVAQGCGFLRTKTISNEDELLQGATIVNNNFNGPTFILLKVDQTSPPQYSRNWNASQAKLKFIQNLLK